MNVNTPSPVLINSLIQDSIPHHQPSKSLVLAESMSIQQSTDPELAKYEKISGSTMRMHPQPNIPSQRSVKNQTPVTKRMLNQKSHSVDLKDEPSNLVSKEKLEIMKVVDTTDLHIQSFNSPQIN